MLKKIAIIPSLLLVFGATDTAAETFHCDFPRAREQGWISPKVIVQVDEKSGETLVADLVLQHFAQAPMAPRNVVNNNRILALHWTLKKSKSNLNESVSNFDYHLTITRKSGKATIRAKPHGYNNEFFQRGSCEVAS